MLILLLLILGQKAFTQTATDGFTRDLANSYSREFLSVINQVQLESDTAYSLGGTMVSDSCVAFMNQSHIVGPVGKAVFHEMTTNKNLYPNLFAGGTVNRYCRKYSEMNSNQKALVWVFVLTTMAHFESSCSVTARARGPNGTAYGYFQLHKGKENEYASETKSCVKNASTNPVLSSQCAMGMLEKQMQRSRGALFNNKSYWEVLRPNGSADKARVIAKALSRLSLCNPKMM